jgi:hypothetical protein
MEKALRNEVERFDEAACRQLGVIWTGQVQSFHDKMTNNEDEVYLYDDLPELLRRDGASDSDSSASDK